MALKYWLPMTDGTLHNQGLSNVQPTNHGATVNTSGKLGKCYDFAGSTSSYIDTGFKESFGTGDFTITAWFKLTDSGNRTYQPIISNKATAAASVGVAIYYNHSQQKFLWSTADGSNATEIWMANTFPYSSNLNIWHHIAMVRNSSDSKKGYFYIDGVRYELASVPPIRNVTNNTNNMFIGSIIAPTTNYMWTGSLCDIRIYDEALSSSEIKRISQGLLLHYSLSNKGFGNENLLTRYVVPGQASPTSTSTAGRTKYYGDYGIIIPAQESADTYFRLFLKEQLTLNEVYTISCQASGLLNGSYIRFPLFAQGNTSMGILNIDHNGLCSLTFTMTYTNQTAATAGSETVYICFLDDAARNYVSGQGAITLTNFKIEKGNKATPFIPSSSDPLYSKLGLDNNIEYNLSGYQYNGTRSGVTPSSDTARNFGCYTFNGTDSYVKCDSNDWMIQGMEEFTVNWWAYSDDWTKVTTGGRMVSCTETGGFNVEGGASGYLRFPRYVYTNEAKTSRAYQYNNSGIKLADLTSGWHMFTLVYDLTGEKIYIDGNLHSSGNYTSYGMYFNPKSRLFLGCEANTNLPSAPYFNGKMTDFRLYSTVLSADDISDLYGGGVA